MSSSAASSAFGKSTGTIGFGIAAIATVLYVAAWELYLYFTNYTFMDEYTGIALEQAQKAGKSASEIAAFAKEMDGFKAPVRQPHQPLGGDRDGNFANCDIDADHLRNTSPQQQFHASQSRCLNMLAP